MSNLEQLPATQRWLIIITVMSAALMQVLDSTIVNVALPHMQGSLGASPDQITWTLTSYMVSSAIFMPLTGYLTDRFGQKQFLLLSIGGFTLASILCGAATSLPEIVVFRLLQGIFGAGLVPLSQSILSTVFSEKDRGKGMAIWGVGVMLGPILGPTLGGYLTEIASWRWTFYVNVPVGIIAMLLTWQVIPDTAKKPRHLDWLGLSLLSLAIGLGQYVLDRGSQADWFSSNEIRIAAIVSLSSLAGFIIHSLHPKKENVFDVRIFKDRNFTISCILLASFGIGLFGGTVLMPLMLENLLNYPVMTTGLVMAPRGIASMISMILVGKLLGRLQPRTWILCGILISVVGYWLNTFYSDMIDAAWIVWPMVIQGFGMGLVFVPLSTLAFATLAPQQRSEAAGLFSLMRVIGGSMGISIVMTILTRHSQMAWHQLVGFIRPHNPAVTQYLSSLHLNISQPLAVQLLSLEVTKQSQMIAFVTDYAFIAWSFLAMLPLLLLIKPSKNAGCPPAKI